MEMMARTSVGMPSVVVGFVLPALYANEALGAAT